ncbi:MAG TPA: DUF4386 domain-containing protein [Methylomirabilota bacterium]|jgi:hypothetical protein|nr:DUF4386 domain-containing protein [Methylomirabilota bacterium]
MQRIGPEDSLAQRTQQRYARLAGFVYLWLIVTDMAGFLTIPRIIGSGTFAEAVARVVASERLYRTALCSELIESLSTVLLAFALYVTLKPVSKLLAQIAMYWRLGESFIGGVTLIFSFMLLRLYLAPHTNSGLGVGELQGLVALTGDAIFVAFNISAIFFSISSTLFFYLFFKSRYIPRVLSAFGVFASILVMIACFATLIFPGHAGRLQYGWAPLFLAEVVTGFWLMLFAVKTQADCE